MFRIVIVEDDETQFELIRGNLADEGVVVEHAANDREALALVFAGPTSAVLIDVDLGPLSASGLDIHRRLRTDPATAPVPVFLLTAHGDWVVPDPAPVHFQKPVDFGSLRKALASLKKGEGR
jgi:CheY-like chemotaxis protein